MSQTRRVSRLRATIGLGVGPGQHGATRNVDVGIELDDDGLALEGLVLVAIHGGDALDAGALARQRVDDRLADADAAGADRAGEAAEVVPVTQHRLHGEAERSGRLGAAARQLLEMLEQARPLVPGHVGERLATLSPETAATGMATASQKPKRHGERAEVSFDLLEALLGPVGEIHLVDGEDDALHTDEIEDGGVAARLRLDAVAGVDQHDGDVGVRSAGGHVARVLLMAGAVDDDEAAVVGVEIAPGDVDGDALLALGDEAVHEQAEIRIAAVDALAALKVAR